jgi:mannose-6-phosphate isomerase-like protein (cupin superfamily)
VIGESDNRPWGKWTILDEGDGDGLKVKRIEVKPHARLSYQTHDHRAEHWVVVVVTASCVIDGISVLSKAGECVDIVRLKDDFGRV